MMRYFSEEDVQLRSPWELSPENQSDGRLSVDFGQSSLLIIYQPGTLELGKCGSLPPSEAYFAPICVERFVMPDDIDARLPKIFNTCFKREIRYLGSRQHYNVTMTVTFIRKLKYLTLSHILPSTLQAVPASLNYPY